MKRLGVVALCLLLVVPAALGAVSPRTQAPRTVGLTLEGERLSLAQLRGKPVFVNVWSSW